MLTLYFIDASPDFVNATIWDDSPTSGVGGWGDPNNDFEISTGAFAEDFPLTYPVPHNLRRNFTQRAFVTDPFGDGTPPAPLDFWNYFTQDRVDLLVDGFVGDFVGFHALFESTTVSRSSEAMIGCSADAVHFHVLGFSWPGPRDCWRVSAFWNQLAWFVVAEMGPNSDLSGACPQGLVAPACVAGPKWTSNGMLFSF
jgi:hypothetical protein